MLIELAVFAQLAHACAPRVAVETLAAIARVESGFDDLAIHDNTSGRSYRPAGQADAVALATELTTRQGHSIDLGMMQVTLANLPGLGMTIADALDPCRSLAAAERVLVGAYSSPGPGLDDQAALRRALSRYNTGNAERGIANGYVQRIQASAEVIVPAIRLRADRSGESLPPSHPLPSGGPAAAPAPTAKPRSAAPWDVYGQARAVKEQNMNIPAALATVGSADAGAAPRQAQPVIPAYGSNQ